MDSFIFFSFPLQRSSYDYVGGHFCIYKIAKINNKDYILPEENATKMKINLTEYINEYLIYSKYYAEPTDLVLNYVRVLYKNLVSTIERKPLTMKLPFLDVNHLEYNINDLYYNNSFGFKINYLKQAIDMYYGMQMGQDIRLLKVCNYCNKAFIAKNPKAEYDTYNCKNKANVYKSRARNSNVVHTETGLSVKIPSKELFDDKKLKSK